MKSTVSRIAAVSLLFAALAAGVMAFTSTGNAVASPSDFTQRQSGVIEPDGTLDSSFNLDRFTNGLVLASRLQADGKLVISGQFSEVHGASRPGIARLNVDGTLDTSFNPGIGTDYGVGDIVIQPDGKIIIAKLVYDYSGGSDWPASVKRLNSDGSLDSGFDPGRVISFYGTNPGGRVYGFVLQPDGKVVVFGQFYYIITGPNSNVPRSCVARFNSDGTFDPTYNPGAGVVHYKGPSHTFVFHAVRQNLGANAGKIIISGMFDGVDGHSVRNLARLNPDGSYDTTFYSNSGTDDILSGLFVQSDDQILGFGHFESFDIFSRHNIVRLNADNGHVDPGFSTEEFLDYDHGAKVLGMAQQADGKLIAVGQFHSLGAATANNVVRLESNGARDASFSGTGAGPSTWNIATALVQPGDGKIFLGGYFSSYGGQVRQSIAWANSDGSVDNGFAGLGGATEYGPNISALALQTDGKVVVAGSFTSYDGTSHNNVLRMNPDGTLDSSFDAQTDRSTRTLLIQPDGKILISGDFSEVNGLLRRRIARLNSDGTLDLSFDPGTGPDQSIGALEQDSQGNIYAGGDFTVFDGKPRLSIVKLSSTGEVDPLFNPGGGGANGPPGVWALTRPDSSGNIVIGGSFTTYNGVTMHRIARVNAITGARDTSFNLGGPGFAGPGFDGPVYVLRQGADGSYYAGGGFGTFNSTGRSHLARLYNYGALDPWFDPPHFLTTVYALALQNDYVYVGGARVLGYSGQTQALVRLIGSFPDGSFHTGTGFEIFPLLAYGQRTAMVSSLVIQPDGKLLVGGIFNRYNGTARSCLARLTATVTPTPTPTPAPSPTSTPAPSPSPTPAGTPSPTPSPTSTVSPTPTATPAPTPTATPSPSQGRALNIATRLLVQTGDNVGIGGFIITGGPKQVLVRGIGPSLAQFGVQNFLADPVMELHGPAGFTTVTNDNWRDSQDGGLAIIATGLQPTNDIESAMLATLNPGAYTAILKGNNNTSGVGLVEVYDLGSGASQLGNISTRAFVGTGDNVVIGGFILGGGGNSHIAIYGVGPSLAGSGVGGALADPTLELRDSSGAIVASNDNCGGSTIHPLDPAEACIDISLPPGAFTAILAGKNGGTGVGLLEIYSYQ
ncbi:MAG TPA: delta-60 repeat domain-containing protein [Chthoniobacterales bacterium]|nr:delta-60 repeat domain-containing protein [Chthoniobacterales bacterium]